MSDRFQRMRERYLTGEIPWDHPDPPPEIIALSQELPPSRAIDLGCGTGRACVWLARAGWQVDGVDFVPEAIAMAQERVAAAGVGDRVRLFVADATNLAFLNEPYDLAIDVGCGHGFSEPELYAYLDEVRRLLKPGGLFVFFVHLSDATKPDAQMLKTRVDQNLLMTALQERFIIEQFVPGETVVMGQRGPSAWIYLRRP
ncbi:MAG TPA: class I SAM-dependent methyltransferase [Chloroflexus aurantiacus]|jgi:SAM-dependent methyltransferase|uniref:Methyltransferase type 11 n=1 Tax=Chloroflexus aurantiacus (strain ATCC 29366 / DSM 635 / J-10-fl) TaxID=324602 RepID=A9WJ44_CHLAA|nr:class I SAM-dependent methyltransferase [Chloroflexus aurantiacus]ABY36503.1 Methyltransferase type 11 [Chloroflexus aurantiacus J-10-fl]HBW68944.1 class I SAM-dependent methyltransferase [Chloroflexus aurantiacus]